MRLVRLAGFALVGTALTACSNSITGPATPDAPLNAGYLLSSGARAPLAGKAATTDGGTCRTGYLLSSGRCGTDESAGTVTATNECRTGYLLSSGRCGQE